ncbi:16S rRNA (guanine(527)-N(7))-methyltransferase RsmG [Limibaculum sp. M0105]|uniref:Ribosomal RNA small subunit methyltransferase G n=1 Tax=Thermohalobaculum xanthum TaxID=2753746 RepID=A0A8J7SG22_9RHOB|nr:16S rRNA (guanine(527)-N(7))-methyltransferase RsmG [Thermohalobaculum xanthum]MBK0400531.1 16S rRNA (guanine(527)-N(7))-methyltransferase RsmG [Thermohalobaculum xanthum]
MTPEGFAAEFDVSRETLDRLLRYEAVLRHWNPRINLVARASLDDVWARHFADSAQLVGLAPPSPANWVDMGSGAGFPGLVVAAILAEQAPGCRVSLIESDGRKSAFLHSAAREMGIEVGIETTRIEDAPARSVDVVSARALAPLDALLALAQRFCGSGTRLLFPKGRMVESELTDARAHWHIDARLHVSRTDPSGRIVEVRDFHPRRDN